MKAGSPVSAASSRQAADGSAVLVTGPAPGGERLSARLEALGFRVHWIPVIGIRPPEDPGPLRAAADRLRAGTYDWVVLTSGNGVRALARALAGLPQADVHREGGSRSPLPARLATVGPATAAAARGEGWEVELTPQEHTGDGLVAAFAGVPVRGARTLLAVAEAARPTVADGLRALGAEVDVVVAYRSAPTEPDPTQRLHDLLGTGTVALTTLASPSAAEGLLDLGGGPALGIPVAVIGPVTAEAATHLGYTVVAVARPHTMEGLADAAAAWLSRSRPAGPP